MPAHGAPSSLNRAGPGQPGRGRVALIREPKAAARRPGGDDDTEGRRCRGRGVALDVTRRAFEVHPCGVPDTRQPTQRSTSVLHAPSVRSGRERRQPVLRAPQRGGGRRDGGLMSTERPDDLPTNGRGPWSRFEDVSRTNGRPPHGVRPVRRRRRLRGPLGPVVDGPHRSARCGREHDPPRRVVTRHRVERNRPRQSARATWARGSTGRRRCRPAPHPLARRELSDPPPDDRARPTASAGGPSGQRDLASRDTSTVVGSLVTSWRTGSGCPAASPAVDADGRRQVLATAASAAAAARARGSRRAEAAACGRRRKDHVRTPSAER